MYECIRYNKIYISLEKHLEEMGRPNGSTFY